MGAGRENLGRWNLVPMALAWERSSAASLSGYLGPLSVASRDNCPSRMDVQARWPAGQSQRCSVEFCLFVCLFFFLMTCFQLLLRAFILSIFFLKICLIGGEG